MTLRNRVAITLVFSCLLLQAVGCASASREALSEKLIFKGDECLGAIAHSETSKVAGRTGRTIRVIVHGQVVKPAEYEVPEGTSVLEAIQIAGGFTYYAWTRDIHLVTREPAAPNRRLVLWKRNRPGSRPLVWLGTRDHAEDFELQDGMDIYVSVQC